MASKKIALGGKRLGAGNKMDVEQENYGRSTHDLGYVWRSTMAAGTLVPFMSKLMLAGDKKEIKLDLSAMTHPTQGPLFGSYKIQLDTFMVPLRLYQPQVILNQINIGHNMEKVLFPQMRVEGNNPDFGLNWKTCQINPSSILAYTGIAGIGVTTNPTGLIARDFMANGLLAYSDIFKTYYANKQERDAYIIHQDYAAIDAEIDNAIWMKAGIDLAELGIGDETPPPSTSVITNPRGSNIRIAFVPATYHEFDYSKIMIWYSEDGSANPRWYKANEIFPNATWDQGASMLILDGLGGFPHNREVGGIYIDTTPDIGTDVEPKLMRFPLENIDVMKTQVLRHNWDEGKFLISKNSIIPFGQIFRHKVIEGKRHFSLQSSQEGLYVKTYNSDLFNNYLMTELIDGDEGINQIARIDTTKGYFTVNELNVIQKIYSVLNKDAVNDGTYDGWQEGQWGVERMKSAVSPVYMGSLIKELIFSEVVSNATTETTEGIKPLGTLAGRGRLGEEKRGGRITINATEPCIVMGIGSITPRVDYSQGIEWHNNLKNWDELHKPTLDGIGFQDLVTENYAWWTTTLEHTGNRLIKKSTGKQPAWINYQTEVNRVYGNFAVESEQMWMTLNRNYEGMSVGVGDMDVKDNTTYIDPVKYNHIFAYTRRDAQNFWIQIKVEDETRRIMSANLMPKM